MHRSDESPRALKQEANVKRILNNSSSTTGYPSRRRNHSRNIRPICHLIYANCLGTRHRYRTTSSPTRSCTVRINHMCRILWIRHNSNRYNKRSIKVRVAPIRLRVALIRLRLVRTRRLRYSPRIIRANNISRPDIINNSLAYDPLPRISTDSSAAYGDYFVFIGEKWKLNSNRRPNCNL